MTSYKTAKINEIFDSIQGEGPYIGYRQLFLRFCGCNLLCDYCDTEFDKGFVYNSNELVEKIKTFDLKNIHSISLTGGEPLLHKNIDTFLEILKNDMRFVRATVFTNGIYIDKHLASLIHPKFIILINVNSQNDIGKNAFEKVDKNIELLIENGMKHNVTLGINVYEENQDFTDFYVLSENIPLIKSE